MSLFSSHRERRLWLWTVAVMVAIYSTLGPTRALVDALRERNLLRFSFALILLLLVGVIVVRWIRQRPGWGEIGVAFGVAFAYLVAFLRIESPEERTHLIEYGIVAALIHQALLERVRNGRRVPAPAALTVAVTALLGLLDEGIQAILLSRVFDIRDVGFNALAGFMAVVARLAAAPQRMPGWRVWFLWLMTGAFGWGQGVYLGWFGGGEPKMLQSIPTVILPGYLGVAVGGILVGMLQWLVLRRHVIRAGRWVLASLGAAAVVGVVIFGVGVVDADRGWVGGVSVFGTVVGVLQWLVLRRQFPRARWWVLASTAGWVVGMPLGDIVGPPGLGAVYGAITGTALVWLLRVRQTPPAANPVRTPMNKEKAVKRFMFLHFGFENPTPEIMESWHTWFESISDKQVDQGGFSGGREISKNGTKDLPWNMESITGYNIIEAESLDAAEELAQSNPFIASIRIYEVRSM